MSALLAGLATLIEVAKEVPALARAIADLFEALHAGQDITPHEKQVQAIAEAVELNLDPSKV